MIAEIFRALAAEQAITVHAAHPGDTHSRLRLEVIRALAQSLHAAHNLMAGNDRLSLRLQVAGGNVQVGAADAASLHAEQYFLRARFGDGNIFET